MVVSFSPFLRSNAMTQTLSTEPAPRLSLRARTAADLLTGNPVSLREDATLAEALVLLIDKRMHAAPVINDAGQPIGVLSGTDILIHLREQMQKGGFIENPAQAVHVRDLMTPAVFSVTLDTPARRIVEEMTSLHVHQLFVVDESGALIGVIHDLNVLRHLSE
jgi:CBS domain-containing protein